MRPYIKNKRKASFCYGILMALIFVVVVVSWATRHAINGGQRFPRGLTNLILLIADLPGQTRSVLSLIENFQPVKGGLNLYSEYVPFENSSNDLNGFVLISYIDQKGVNQVAAIDLKTKGFKPILSAESWTVSSLYTDNLTQSETKRQPAFSSRNRIWHPHLSKKGVLTFSIQGNDLISVDLNSRKVLWSVRGAFHHSIESDSNGNLWVCASIEAGSFQKTVNMGHQSNKFFDDQALVKISPNGKILDVISVADLLLNAGLEYLLYGVSNPNKNLDPIHLNQITPIIKDQGLLKKGQILISLRNLSTIILLDPVKKEVVWHKCGPWMNQHCAFPIAPSEISVLDNHSFASGKYWLHSKWETKIFTFNMESEKTHEILLDKNGDKKLKIPIEGRALKINPETWMLEDSVGGALMIFKSQRLIFKWSNIYGDGTIGAISWSRYIEENEFPESILTTNSQSELHFFDKY